MWTPTTRQQHSRPVTRYQTDLTDAEWRVIAPHLPEPCAMGRPRAWPTRESVNGIFYVMRAGCPWRLLPNDLPPWGTIYRWFAAWRDDGRFERINHALVMADRERVGRDASPSAAIIDSQSVKTTEAGGPRGYDAGKKVNGRKRHALVDTEGRGLVLEPHPASIQDRDGGGPLLQASRRVFPFIERVFADSGYAGDKVTTATLIASKSCAKIRTKSASPLTGPAGERQLCGEIIDGGDHHDLERARQQLRHWYDAAEVEREMIALTDSVNHFVRQRWARQNIRALSGYLLMRGRLTAADVARIVAP